MIHALQVIPCAFLEMLRAFPETLCAFQEMLCVVQETPCAVQAKLSVNPENSLSSKLVKASSCLEIDPCSLMANLFLDKLEASSVVSLSASSA